MKKYRSEFEIEKEERSSGSVISTHDRAFAFYIHEQAIKVGGKASVYVAERLA
ncbi:unnamed protein product [marine sediment metagenome]|uniref:Uncharacterized protein n=1 Tax=marine sediment metagenome TaxID=412755 RepID=X1E5D2_9ZZZZ